MTTLSTSLINPESGATAFWISLQQETVPQFATVAEAAEVIDSLYHLDPCVDLQAIEEKVDTELTDKLKAAQDELWRQLSDEEKAALCADAGDCFTAKVKVYRSHQAKPYRLLIQGGTMVKTVTGLIDQRRQVVMVQDANTVTMDLPGDQQLTASWQGPCYSRLLGRLDQNPPLRIAGNTISWDGNLTGTILVEYQLPYDLAEIRSAGSDCTVTGLYHLATDEISLEAPPKDEQAAELCRQINSRSSDLAWSDFPCYRKVEYSPRCSCSGDSAGGGYTMREEVGCPDGVKAGTTVELVERVSYVDCGEVERVHDPGYYEKVCCDSPPWPLPLCKERLSIFGGKGISSEKVAELEARFGARLNLIGVGPTIEPCGRLIVRQSIDNKNCCDQVEPLSWSPDNPQQISPGGSVQVQVSWGAEVLEWRVGGGLYFSNGRSLIETADRVVDIYAPATFCAIALLRVTDGCSGLAMTLHNTSFESLAIPAADRLVAPGSMIGIVASGGVQPYTWSSDKLLHLGNGVFLASDDFCGTATVTVTDSCSELADCVVRSTEGFWQSQPIQDICSGYNTTGATVFSWNIYGGSTELVSEGIKIMSYVEIDYWGYGTCGPCPCGSDLGSVGAVLIATGNSDDVREHAAESLVEVSRWVCNDE